MGQEAHDELGEVTPTLHPLSRSGRQLLLSTEEKRGGVRKKRHSKKKENDSVRPDAKIGKKNAQFKNKHVLPAGGN